MTRRKAQTVTFSPTAALLGAVVAMVAAGTFVHAQIPTGTPDSFQATPLDETLVERIPAVPPSEAVAAFDLAPPAPLPMGATSRVGLPIELQPAVFLADQEPDPRTDPESKQAIHDDARPRSEDPYYDYRVTCDVNDDAVDDYLSHSLERPPVTFHDGRLDPGDRLLRSVLRMRSGENGNQLWSRADLNFTWPGSVPSWTDRAHSGESDIDHGNPYLRPRPQPFDAVPTNLASSGDLDGNGVCDLVQYGFDARSFNATDPSCAPHCPPFGLAAVLRAVDGLDGRVIWERVESVWELGNSTSAAGVATCYTFEVHNVPLELWHYEATEGPRLLWRTRDTFSCYAGNYAGNLAESDGWVTEHLYHVDARTGAVLWHRVFAPWPQPYTPLFQPNHSVNASRITGVADVNGDGIRDVVLDQLRGPVWHGVQRQADIGRNPDFLPWIWVLALDGRDATTLWETRVTHSAVNKTHSKQALFELEEDCEAAYDTNARLVRDITGDGVDDPVVIHYDTYAHCGEGYQSVSANGRLLFHVIPLDGATGAKLWTKDVRIQGFGYVDSLTAGDAGGDRYLAVGSSDVPDRAARGARFPPKAIRLTVLGVDDGNVRWSFQKPFGLNNHLTYHLAMQQFHNNLAPHDWNHDGIRDVVTASQFIDLPRNGQILLSGAGQRFDILDGKEGSSLYSVRPWGTAGVAVPCADDPEKLTILNGHPRRVDVTRYDPEKGDVQWRHPVWFDPRIYPTTIGVDFTLLGLSCQPDSAGRLFYGLNAGTFTFYRTRGFETFSEVSFLRPDGSQEWIRPTLMKLFGLAPEDPILRDTIFGQTPPTPTLWDQWMGTAFTAGISGLSGIAAGVGRTIRDRRGHQDATLPEATP